MQRNAYFLLLGTTLLWGANAVAGKLAVGHVSPMMLTALRWSVAFLVLLCIGHRRLRADWPLARGHLSLLFLLGFFGFTLFNVALYTALAHTSAINVSIEQGGIPMFIFLINFLVFRVRVAPGQMVGFVVSMAGIVLVASHGAPARLLALELNLGDALMLGAVLVYAGYTVALRFKPAIHWQSFLTVLSAAAFVGTLPFVAVEYVFGALTLPDARGWALVAFIALFPSLLAQVFYVRGVELIGSNRAGLFVNLVPIFGTVLSILVLGEDLRPYHALALAMTLGGIFIAERSGRRLAGYPAGR